MKFEDFIKKGTVKDIRYKKEVILFALLLYILIGGDIVFAECKMSWDISGSEFTCKLTDMQSAKWVDNSHISISGYNDNKPIPAKVVNGYLQVEYMPNGWEYVYIDYVAMPDKPVVVKYETYYNPTGTVYIPNLDRTIKEESKPPATSGVPQTPVAPAATEKKTTTVEPNIDKGSGSGETTIGTFDVKEGIPYSYSDDNIEDSVYFRQVKKGVYEVYRYNEKGDENIIYIQNYKGGKDKKTFTEKELKENFGEEILEYDSKIDVLEDKNGKDTSLYYDPTTGIKFTYKSGLDVDKIESINNNEVTYIATEDDVQYKYKLTLNSKNNPIQKFTMGDKPLTRTETLKNKEVVYYLDSTTGKEISAKFDGNTYPIDIFEKIKGDLESTFTTTKDANGLVNSVKVTNKGVTTKQVFKDSQGTLTTKTEYGVNGVPAKVEITLGDGKKIEIDGKGYALYEQKLKDTNKDIKDINTEIGILIEYAKIRDPTDITYDPASKAYVKKSGEYIEIKYSPGSNNYQILEYNKENGIIKDATIINTQDPNHLDSNRKGEYTYTQLDKDSLKSKSITDLKNIEGVESKTYDKNHWPVGVGELYLKYVCGDGECSVNDRDKADKVKICSSGESICNDEATGSSSYQKAKDTILYSRIGPALQAAYEGAQGGKALSTLFGCKAGESGLCSEWRKTMDEFFANNVLGQIISGNWEESLCHNYIERETPGVALIEIPDTMSMVGVGAHIEAEKSAPLTYPNETEEYLYKITYGVRNPQNIVKEKEQKVSFNVELSGERTVLLYNSYIEVKEKGKVAITIKDPIVQYSNYKYDKICLIFEDKIRTATGSYISEVCNKISEYTGEPIGYKPSSTSNGTSANQSTSSQPEINLI